MHTAHDAPVVIVGAGPAGMCLAIDLAQAGVASTLLEARAADARFAARTNVTNSRSMEHFRRWGVAERLRRNVPLGPEISRDIRFVTRVTGHVIANFKNGVQFAERAPFASEVSVWGPHSAIERSLRERIAELPSIDLRFNASVTQFGQDDEGVTVHYTDADGCARQVRGGYCVAADGSRSLIRRQLGLKMQGKANLVYGFSWLIRSPPLTDLMRRGTGLAAMTWFANDDRSGAMLVPQDSDHHYQYFAACVPRHIDGANWDAVRACLYTDVGARFEVEAISGDDLWIHSLAAPRFAENRVFLIGDAAHLVSPFGGFGMNIAVGDAADLGWKLRAVIQGWGGARLLASYDAERRPAFHWIQALCEESTQHIGPAYVRPDMEADTPAGAAIRADIAQEIIAAKQREFVSIGAQLGYAYPASPICVDDAQSHPPHTPSSFGHYAPSSAPGARAPHVWLTETRSLYDALGAGFTLLCMEGDRSASGVAALADAAAARRVPFDVIASDHPDLPALYGVRFALIRPDHHIAWRGDAIPPEPGALLDTVRGA